MIIHGSSIDKDIESMHIGPCLYGEIFGNYDRLGIMNKEVDVIIGLRRIRLLLL